LAVLAVAVPARAAERCALVVAAQPEPDEAALEAARRALPGCELVADPALRGVLEGFERPATPEERARDAMGRAHGKLRRFDAAGVHQALDEAWAAAVELPANAEGRQLVVQLALEQAELAVIEHDAAAQVRAMRLALAVDPELRLDEGRASPATVALLGRARAEAAHAAPVTVEIVSQPPGAQVWAGGWRGETPLSQALPEGPAVVWLSRPGYRNRALRLTVAPGARVDAALEPLSEAERLRPLVDALRQSAGETRRQPALALAAALGVHAVAVVEASGGAPTVYAPEPPAPAAVAADLLVIPAAPSRRSPWYKKTWPWVLIVGGAAVAATAVGVGVAYGSPSVPTLSCCR